MSGAPYPLSVELATLYERTSANGTRYLVALADFLGRADLLGRWFSPPSWAAWRICLRAAFGEPLDPQERAIFQALAERDPPQRRVRELWLAIGRRAGKDT